MADARLVLAGPLIHCSAMVRALGALTVGSAVVMTYMRQFDPRLTVMAVGAHRANPLAVVGEVYARPIFQS